LVRYTIRRTGVGKEEERRRREEKELGGGRAVSTAKMHSDHQTADLVCAFALESNAIVTTATARAIEDNAKATMESESSGDATGGGEVGGDGTLATVLTP